MTIVTVTLNPCIDKVCTVDRLLPDRKLTAGAVRRYPGGGGINVARAVTRLGGSPLALWTCGGPNGHRLARLLDEERVRHETVSIEDDVRENVIVSESSSDHQYRLGMPGPTLTDGERAHWCDRLREFADGAQFVVFSGSLPGGTTPDFYGDLLECIPGGPRIVVDTKGPALQRALEHGVFLVKPNIRELEEITGAELNDDQDVEQSARELVRGGRAEAVLVSLGRGGAMLVAGDRAERFVSPTVPLRSKIGAGDSMVGGLVAALAEDRALDDAVRFAVAAGAAAVMTPGTELCRREDVMDLHEQVEFREVGR